jgi:hypothetical protein
VGCTFFSLHFPSSSLLFIEIDITLLSLPYAVSPGNSPGNSDRDFVIFIVFFFRPQEATKLRVWIKEEEIEFSFN